MFKNFIDFAGHTYITNMFHCHLLFSAFKKNVHAIKKMKILVLQSGFSKLGERT